METVVFSYFLPIKRHCFELNVHFVVLLGQKNIELAGLACTEALFAKTVDRDYVRDVYHPINRLS